MRKFNLKRASDGRTLAWSQNIEQVKQHLDMLYEEAYILVHPGDNNVVEYSFPEWYRTNNVTWDEVWGQQLQYQKLIEYENKHYTPISK